MHKEKNTRVPTWPDIIIFIPNKTTYFKGKGNGP
jgi:hypothetical protein